MSLADLIPWRGKQQEREGTETTPALPAPRLFSDLDRMFDRLMREAWPFEAGTGGTGWTGWGPTLDITEGDDNITIRAEVPGVDPKDLEITITGDVLTIAGEKREQTERKETNVWTSECRYGSFRRGIPLPAAVDAENVEASFKDGVVTIDLKKSPAAHGKKIEVKT